MMRKWVSLLQRQQLASWQLQGRLLRPPSLLLSLLLHLLPLLLLLLLVLLAQEPVAWATGQVLLQQAGLQVLGCILKAARVAEHNSHPLLLHQQCQLSAASLLLLLLLPH
jgi:hypothetical protein